jgi:hypothetical protein
LPITFTSPSSKAGQKSGSFPPPALPGFNGSRSTAPSAIRRATDFINLLCVRKRPQTTRHRDIPDAVVITRKCHAFEGRSLAVISSIRRRGVLLWLASLPDGSRSLIPAAWTDWRLKETLPTSIDDLPHTLGRVSDLLQARTQGW